MRNATPLLLVMMAALLVISIAGLWLREPAPAQNESGEDLRAIRESMNEMVDSLDQIERALARERPLPPVPQPETQDSSAPSPVRLDEGEDALLAALEALIGELRASGGVVSSGAAGRAGLDGARRTKSEADWIEWDRVADVWQEDEDAARRSVQLLTPAQLVSRFGPPTQIFQQQNGNVRWHYRDPQDKRVPIRFRCDVDFADGYVTQLNLDRFAPYSER